MSGRLWRRRRERLRRPFERLDVQVKLWLDHCREVPTFLVNGSAGLELTQDIIWLLSEYPDLFGGWKQVLREEFQKHGDTRRAVADGLAKTARVITAAAAIMVVVFGAFVFEDDRTVKMFGIGLAMAVLLDATIVRMLLVPATMELLGNRNWWLPKWLDRVLPKVNVEGHHAEQEVRQPVGAGV